MPARHRAQLENGHLRTNERVLVPLPIEMRANILKRVLLHTTSDCAMDPVAAIIAFASAGEIDWTAPNFVGWFLYDSVDAATTSIPEWQTKSLKRGFCGSAIPKVANAKVAPDYLKNTRDAGMS